MPPCVCECSADVLACAMKESVGACSTSCMRPKAGAITKAKASHHPKQGVRAACMRENQFIPTLKKRKILQEVEKRSVCVAHAAVFAQCQAFAAGLQLLLAVFIRLASSQTLRSLLVRAGHATVALNIFLGMGINLGRRSSGWFAVAVRRIIVAVGMVLRPRGGRQQQSGCRSTKQRFHGKDSQRG